MERSMLAVAPDELRVYAAALVRCLQQWNPLDDALARDAQRKQDFVDALTEISALPSDSLAMEIRRLLVDGGGDDADATDASASRHLTYLVGALSHRDVLLKCKVANAVGSLCTSRVAGQRLLDLHGEALVASLSRMATSRNTWAQADAFFVFGWAVVIGEDALVQQQLARFVGTAVKLLARNLAKDDAALDEQDANLRIYCLVFLLNFSQRDGVALERDLVRLLETLGLMVRKLLAATAAMLSDDGTTGESEHRGEAEGNAGGGEKLAEHLEFVRLTVTLLGAVVEQLDAAPAVVISLKMLPDLLKLDQALHSDVLRRKLRAWRGEEDTETNDGDDDDDDELQDLKERMRTIKDAVLASR